MALLPFDRTCHRLSYRVIVRKKLKLPQTKTICIIRLCNDADSYNVKVFRATLLSNIHLWLDQNAL